MEEKPNSIVLSSTTIKPPGFRFLTLQDIKYKDPTGRERKWESAERQNRNGAVDGVAIIAQVSCSGQPTQLILESQFRPSQSNYVIEFPAGLVDKGESPEQAAVRELREETGDVIDVSAIGYSDPGMTNSNMQAVTIAVDADAPENKDVQPQLEEGEFIEVFLLPYNNLYAKLQELQKTKGWDIDAKLLMYAMGLQQAIRLGL